MIEDRIRARMKDIGLTQGGLADELSMAEEKLNRCMQDPDLAKKHLDEIAAALLCRPDYLSGMSDDVSEPDDPGSRIRRLRYENHLTQKQLAEKVHLSPYLIRMMESGKAKFIDKQQMIAEVFGKPADYFSSSQTELPDKEEFHGTDKGTKKISEGLQKKPDNDHKEDESMIDIEKPMYVTDEEPIDTQEALNMPEPVLPDETQDDKEDLASIGKRLEQARNDQSMTAQMLGEKAGVSGSLIRSIENGKGNPRLDVFCRIAEEAGTTGSYLASGKNDLKPLEETSADDPLGSVLKKLRECMGWKFSDLAKKSGVSSSTITKLEYTSDTNIQILMKLAQSLQCPLGVLLLYVKPASGGQKTQANRPSKIKTNTDQDGLDDAKITSMVDEMISSLTSMKKELASNRLSDKEKKIIAAYRGMTEPCRKEFERHLEFLSSMQEM